MRGYVKRVKQKAEKLSKEQVLSLFETIAEENESLYSVLESLSTGLLIINDDFQLLRYNTIVESWLPFTQHLEDIQGTEIRVFECIDDEDIAAFLRKCMEKDITNSSEDFSTVTPGGSVRFITITISPLVSEGELSGKVILVRDITEKKNQDVLLHRMENLANLTNLAAGMAHEIKNPLGAISIHIQLIQKALEKARENQDKLPAKKFVENHIDVVNEEIDHLNKLVMDFLLAVRPIKAQLELKNPDKVIENLVNFFTPEFNKEKIETSIIYAQAIALLNSLASQVEPVLKAFKILAEQKANAEYNCEKLIASFEKTQKSSSKEKASKKSDSKKSEKKEASEKTVKKVKSKK